MKRIHKNLRKVIVNEGHQESPNSLVYGSYLLTYFEYNHGGEQSEYTLLDDLVIYSNSYLSPEELAIRFGTTITFDIEDVNGDIADYNVDFDCPSYTRPPTWPEGI